MAQNKNILKMMKNQSLMLSIMNTAFKDAFPFGDLTGAIKHHMSEIGKGYLSDELQNEMVKRQWVSIATPEMKITASNEVTHMVDHTGLDFLRNAAGNAGAGLDRTLIRKMMTFLSRNDYSGFSNGGLPYIRVPYSVRRQGILPGNPNLSRTMVNRGGVVI